MKQTPEPRTGMNLWLMGLLAAAFSALAGAGATSSFEPPPSEGAKAQTKPAASNAAEQRQAPREVHVSPEWLLQAYETNEVAADTFLKDRELHMGARVTSIKKDRLGNVVLRFDLDEDSLIHDAITVVQRTIGNGRDEPYVTATLVEDETTKAATLRKQEMVFLTCTGNGVVDGVPALRDCTL